MKWYNKVCPFLHILSPPPSIAFTFQTDTVRLFYPKGFKGSLLPEYKTLPPPELLMVAEKQKKVRNASLWRHHRQGSGVVHLNSIHIQRVFRFFLFSLQPAFPLSIYRHRGEKALFKGRTHKHMTELFKVLTACKTAREGGLNRTSQSRGPGSKSN